MVLLRNGKEVKDFLECFNSMTFAFDTETTSLRYYDMELLGLSISDGESHAYIPYPWDNDVTSLLHELFINAKNIIAHNITFDVAILRKYGFKFPTRVKWFDTMVAAHLLDENREKGLKKLVKLIFDYDMTTMKDLLSLYGSTKDIPESVMADYACEDAQYTMALANQFKHEMIEQGVDMLFKRIEMPFLRTIIEMETQGIGIDKSRLNRLKIELAEAKQGVLAEMYEYLNEPYSIQQSIDGNSIEVVGDINFNSSVQLRSILFDRLELPIIETTNTGSPSTGAVTINTLAKNNEFVALLQKYRIIQKLLTSFFNPLPTLIDSDGRIRTRFNNTGTVTGRLSSSEPNLQQLPKPNKNFPVETRACFIASKGKKMIAVDYSQQELRIMAQLSKDPTLIKSLKEGLDLHLYTANRVFGLGIPEEKLYSTHPESEEIKSKFKKDRDKGKSFSFGIPYGMGQKKASKDLGCSEEEALGYLDKYFEEFPELKKAIDETHKQAEEKGYVTTYTGRRRRFERDSYGRIDFRGLRQSFNFLIQSFGADLIRIACVKLFNYARRNPEYGIKLLMTVHDEIVFECYEEYAEEVARESEKILESCGNMIVPLTAEANIGDNYGEAK